MIVAEFEFDIRECRDDLLRRLEMEVRRGKNGGGRDDVLIIRYRYVNERRKATYVHVSGPLRKARPVT